MQGDTVCFGAIQAEESALSGSNERLLFLANVAEACMDDGTAFTQTFHYAARALANSSSRY
jgi:hypothetical protein